MITPKLHKQHNNQYTFKIMWEYQTCQQSDVSQLHFLKLWTGHRVYAPLFAIKTSHQRTKVWHS